MQCICSQAFDFFCFKTELSRSYLSRNLNNIWIKVNHKILEISDKIFTVSVPIFVKTKTTKLKRSDIFVCYLSLTKRNSSAPTGKPGAAAQSLPAFSAAVFRSSLKTAQKCFTLELSAKLAMISITGSHSGLKLTQSMPDRCRRAASRQKSGEESKSPAEKRSF